MGLQTVPAFIGQAGYQHPVELMRNMNEHLFGRTGITRYGNFALSPGAATRSVDITAGAVAIVGTENAQQGAYFAWSDATQQLVFGAASGNPRIDTILLRIKDGQYGTISGQPEAYFDIVQGVAAASPVARADSDFNSGGSFYIPGAWWRVGDVRINVADTGVLPGGQITSNLRYTRNSNGRFPCTSTTRPTDVVAGDTAFETDTLCDIVYTGSAWKLMTPYKRTQVLGSAAATVTFSSIPTSLNRLKLIWRARGDAAAGGVQLGLRVNADSTANYYGNWQQQNNVTASYNAPVGITSAFVGVMVGNGGLAGAGFFGVGEIDVIGWSGLAKINGLFRAHAYDSTTHSYLTHGGWLYNVSGTYTSISMVALSGNFITGSSFTIEGWD